MSYMGPRFVGGGQMFRQNQNQPNPNMQRQYQQQVMQMTMQFQQNIKNHLQRHNSPRPPMNSNMDKEPGKGKPVEGMIGPVRPQMGQGNKPALCDVIGKTGNLSNVNAPGNRGSGGGPSDKPGSSSGGPGNQSRPNQQNQNKSQSSSSNQKPSSTDSTSTSKDTEKSNNPDKSRQDNNKNKNPPSTLSPPKPPNFALKPPNTPANTSIPTSKPENFDQKSKNQNRNFDPKFDQNRKFDNKPNDSQGSHQQQQSSSLMGPHPASLDRSPHKQDSDQKAPQHTMNSSYNNNNQNSYDQRARQDQPNSGRDQYSRPPRGGPNEGSAHWDSFNRPKGGNYNNERGNRPGMQGGPSGYKGPKGFYGQDKIKERIQQLFVGPQVDLPALDMGEKKFNCLAKLFVGNLPKNCEQEEIAKLFGEYGETGSIYVNKDSSFAFVTYDFKSNAMKAMKELDNKIFKNRYLKVRNATITEGIRVKNLSPYVTNELLEKSFSAFGVIDVCRIVVDDRGISKGEGILMFRDKKSAAMATKKCTEECFFLSGALRPVIVLPLEPTDDCPEGLPETAVSHLDEYRSERETLPHFADGGSFEWDFGMQWKQLYGMYEEKKAALDKDFQTELERLEKKMVLAKVEYETEKLRKELAQREAETAELRRQFDYKAEGGYGAPPPPTAMRPPSSTGASYDQYPSGGVKRSIESPYDSTYDNYDRSYDSYRPATTAREGYVPPEDYDRLREAYDPYDAPPKYDRPPPTETKEYDAPNKRPRY